jgi:hypothetical protein
LEWPSATVDAGDGEAVADEYERLPEQHETYLYWSMITVIGRRAARRQKSVVTPPAAPALSLAAKVLKPVLTERRTCAVNRSHV